MVVIAVGYMNVDDTEEFLERYVSPTGEYTVDIYITQPNATVDFSIKAYLVKENNKVCCIYNAYHEFSAEVFWVNDNVISINGKQLNLSKGDVFDWRN